MSGDGYLLYLNSMLGKKTICKELRGAEILNMRSPQRPGPAPMPEAAEKAPAADSSLSSSSSSSSSSSCSEAPVAEGNLWTGKNAFATEVLFWVPGRSQRRQRVSFIQKKCIHFISHKCGHGLQCICQSFLKAFQAMRTPWITDVWRKQIKNALKQVPARKCQRASDECQHVSDRDAKPKMDGL